MFNQIKYLIFIVYSMDYQGTKSCLLPMLSSINVSNQLDYCLHQKVFFLISTDFTPTLKIL